MRLVELIARCAQVEMAGLRADGRLKVLDQGVKWIMGITRMITKAQVARSIIQCAIMVRPAK